MRHILFIFSLIAAGPAAAAPDIAAALDDVELHLPVPDGYCAIDQSRPEEGKLFQIQADALQPLNRLLGVAIDCGELDAYRTQQKQFTRYIEFMATQHDGQPIRRPDAERTAYLNELAAQLPKLDPKTVADLANQHTQPLGVTTSIERFGQITRDDAALYLGGIANYNAATVANVSALTLAGGQAISSSFYRSDVNDGTIAGLLDEAKSEARALITANAAIDTAPPATGNAAERIESSAITTVLAALALLIALAVSFVLRRRRAANRNRQ